jgi:spore germination cell wall hydrolase CwlJ-like protein
MTTIPAPSDFVLPYEPKPRDFAARLSRRKLRSLNSLRRQRHSGRRAAMLFAAVAVPAFAAPQAFESFEIGNAVHSAVKLEPMPFEKPGDSFPGSAFYYLAAADEAETFKPGLGDGIYSDAGSAPGMLNAMVGPAARPMLVDNSGVDRTRAEQCLTAAVYYEAATEPDAGQRAVAQVVLNRVAHRSYPNTVCGVVYQGSERKTGCQFSFTCDGSLARVPNRFFWERAAAVARAALAGYVYTPVGLATHYHTFAVHPYWSDSLLNIANIGAHRFFRIPGRAGEAGAFQFAYAGGEPIAAPHPRSVTSDLLADSALDPLALQKAYDAGLGAAQMGSSAPRSPGPATPILAADRTAKPLPSYTPELIERGGELLYKADKLPETSGIRPEYQNSGRWINKPGT